MTRRWLPLPALLLGLVAAGCATLDPAEAYREGETLRFRGAGVSAPARLAGCSAARILTRDDPVDGVAVYRCGRLVRASIWTRSIGWGQPADAFENARDLLPGKGVNWRMSEEPVAVTSTGHRLAVRRVTGLVESRLWLTSDQANPKVVLEVAWRTGDPDAQAQAGRALNVLLESVEVP